MSTKIKPPHVYVANVSEKLGLGVFAIRAFIRNEVIEVAPVFLLEEKFSNLPIEFKHRTFNWGYLAKSHISNAIAMGYGSIYNHSDHPNLRYEANTEEKVIKFIAQRNIDPNEQLTIHYNQENDGSEPDKADWFGKKGIEKHAN